MDILFYGQDNFTLFLGVMLKGLLSLSSFRGQSNEYRELLGAYW